MNTLFIVDEVEIVVDPGDTMIDLSKWASKIVHIGAALDCSEAFKNADKENSDDWTQQR